jgi:GntR family transcriptional regulator
MLETQVPLRRINKGFPLPYYYQIAQSLREMIGDAEVKAQERGDAPPEEIALPSEAELGVLYHVTRGTVRHALEVLEREGLIYRAKGRGTFVRRRVQLDLARLVSTTEDLIARGWVPSVKMLGLRRLAPRPYVQRPLQLPDNSEVWEIYRLRLANGEAISLQWSFIPCALAPGLDQHDLTTSLYYTLRDAYGIQLKVADQTIRARVAEVDEAALLGVTEGAPVFVIDRTSYDQHQVPVEYLHSFWRGDRYDLQVRLLSPD